LSWTLHLDKLNRRVLMGGQKGVRRALAWIAVALALAWAGLAHAGPVVERIKAQGVIRCGGAPRPGLVGNPEGRDAAGLYLDLCRAVGAALLGPDGRIEFGSYNSDKAFGRVESRLDDLSFVDGSEILDHRLAGKLTIGPPVYFASTAAMVHGDAPISKLGDLAGKSICFYQGDGAHRHLEDWMSVHRLDFVRMGNMEYGEMYDAFSARVCDAVVGETGDLAAARVKGGKNLSSRILDESLATFPVFAATPASDPQWSAIVAWAVFALERAELRATPWKEAGIDAVAPAGDEFGLPSDWRKRVIRAAGSYADIYARNLGEGSQLKLPRGANAPAELGGLFVTPYRE
jgi:general L-amino acid transport system substrate-binding protein